METLPVLLSNAAVVAEDLGGFAIVLETGDN
jgi:hypothetical protein